MTISTRWKEVYDILNTEFKSNFF